MRFRDLIWQFGVKRNVRSKFRQHGMRKSAFRRLGSSCLEFLPKPGSFIVAMFSNSDWSFVVHVQRTRRDF